MSELLHRTRLRLPIKEAQEADVSDRCKSSRDLRAEEKVKSIEIVFINIFF